MTQSNQKPRIVITFKELLARYKICKSTAYNRMNPAHPGFSPDFPKKIKMGRATVFLDSAADAYVDACISKSTIEDEKNATSNSMKRGEE